MRRVLFVAALAAASCDDARPAPAVPTAPAKAAAADAPFEASFDDPQLAERVLDAARTGSAADLAMLKLPARCDRVRVAVRVLHDRLLGVRPAPPDLPALFAAFDALESVEGGASAASLAPLVAAWRAWSPAEAAAEKDLALRYARALDAMRAPKLDSAALAAALAGAPAAPPKSPAAADLAFVRAAALFASAPDDGSVSADIADALAHAQRQFADLGWPGGFGSLAEFLARRLLSENPKSFRSIHLADLAQAAYARSGDEVRASLVFLLLSEAAERAGDVKRAEYLADGGRLRLLQAAGARGRELVDVLLRHGGLAQSLGRQADAARDLSHAWEEAKWAALDAAARVAVAEKFATTLFLTGRFAEASGVACEAALFHDDAAAAGAREIEPSRTVLEEIAAQAALELGRAAEAAERYRAAAARRVKLAASDASQWPMHDTDALLAAQARLKGGDAADAAREIVTVLGRDGVQPPARAHASSVYREAGRLDDAERELSRAEKDGGADFAAALTEERARLAAARGDAAAARDLFGKAVARATKDDPGAIVGWDAARVLLDWARMEADLGRLFEASEPAGRAVVQLRSSGLAMQLDRARELYAGLQRRRLWFVTAENVTAQRVEAGPPGGAPRREDALFDLLVLRTELLAERQKDAEKNALAAVEMFPAGWRRDLARRAVDEARGVAQPGAPPAVPAGASPRWTLLRDVLALAEDDFDGTRALCARCGASEPELRRAAAAKFRHGAHPWVHELRRRADAAGDLGRPAGEDTVLSVEPYGDHLEICTITAGHAGQRRVEGDGGLAAFREATLFEPTPERLAAAAKAFGGAVFAGADGRRLIVSIPEPYGPLPLDLVPFGDGTLLDRFEVIVVPSVTESLSARARRAPPILSVLTGPYATLDARHAIVQIGEVDPAARARLFALLGRFQNEGKDAGAALRAAKLALRDEWKPDPKSPPALPPWAAFVLRGAP